MELFINDIKILWIDDNGIINIDHSFHEQKFTPEDCKMVSNFFDLAWRIQHNKQ